MTSIPAAESGRSKPARALRENLAAEANQELARRSSPAAMAYAVLLLVVAFFTPYPADHPWIIGVSGVSVAVLGVVRILLSRKLLAEPGAASRWGPGVFRVGVYLSASTWSLFSALTMAHYGEQWTGMLVLLMTAGIAAGGLTSLAPDVHLARFYLVIMLGPSIVTSAVRHGPEGAAAALTVGIYTAFLMVGAGQQHSNYWRAIEDRAALKIKAAELEEARVLADAATIAKSTFLANMSHEIRTPMNAVIGMTEVMLDSNLDPQSERSARIIKDASESLLAIVNDILDLSRIEAGKVELDPSPFKLRDSVHEVLRALALRAHDKGLELSCHILRNVPDAWIGDAGRLRQVLLNLMSNAIKFTPSGSIRVKVQVKEDRGESAVLHFSVADTGVGIPVDAHTRVLEPFMQADNTTTRQFGGTGLGLSISRKVVEMMKGRMWFESAPGKGSTFHFTGELLVSKFAAPRFPEEGVQRLRGLHVLVVEDDPDSSRILAEMLEDWGMHPTLVADDKSAGEALAAARGSKTRFAFGLVEAGPGAGFDTARAMLQDADGPKPIMLLTSNRERPDAGVCRELGMKVHLIKPVGESDLFDAMMTLHGGRPIGVRSGAHAAKEGEKSIRILLVEDNPVNQLVAQELLGRLGHTVITVSNGRLALAKLADDSRFDVIFMDVQMPEMDGFQTTAAIRDREKAGARRIPIIAMTAHAMKGDRERCLAGGMDGYVSKPVQTNALREAIASVGAGRHEASVPVAHEKSPSFDRSDLLERLGGGNPSILRNVIDLFKEDCPARLSQVRSAIETRNGKLLNESAHSLKGSLLALSATAAANAAQKLESMGRAGEFDGAAAVLAELESEVARLLVELPRLLEDRP